MSQATDTTSDEAGIWHTFEAAEAAKRLNTDPDDGLSNRQAQERRAEHGPNELVERGRKSPWRILWEQLSDTLVIVLIVAGVVSALLGDVEDAIAIFVIVVLNALIGFRQEYRAERAMAALKKLAVPSVKVRRGGHTEEISAREIVPGDIVLLAAGQSVPADGRLLESPNLRIQEAALTGESTAVEKDAGRTFSEETALADRRNMAFMGTAVTYGRGTMVVTETGMATELGNIATMLQTVSEESTPLQRRLAQLGRVLATVALVIVAIIFVLGVLRSEELTRILTSGQWLTEPSRLLQNEDLKLLFLTAVSLAVAAVPEGLPAVVTIALALGAQRMLRRNALIRELPAVETLGSVTVICSDKTGTLTRNKMTVAVIDVAGQELEVEQEFIDGVQRDDVREKYARRLAEAPAIELTLLGGALCTDAELEFDESDEEGKHFHTLGDPTETALVAAAASLGLEKPQLMKRLPRVDEVPFDSDRKRMTTVHRFAGEAEGAPAPLAAMVEQIAGGAQNSGRVAFTKGAVEALLDVSSHVWADGEVQPIDDGWRERIRNAHDRLAGHGMRVLGVAVNHRDEQPSGDGAKDWEKDLVFLGLIGMIDPPRSEATEAVEQCRTAGIRPVMITGDHPLTARFIAGETAISDGATPVTGQDIDGMSEEELDKTAASANVYARVTPEHKLRLVESLQRQGQVVAMTGDGVNDAPALKKADIGVAMGIAGTDVAKEASDMVLQDDNFATIVAAVEQGRIIFDNIRKFIRYLLSANVGEVLVMLIGPLLGMPLPLWPLQILWMNLVTDGFPALALGVEPAERNTMKRPPYPPGESVFARGIGIDIVWLGSLMGLVSLGVGYAYWLREPDTRTWQTVVFTTLTLSQMTLALAVRSERESLFTQGLLTNKSLLAAVCLTFVLQLLVVYTPLLQPFFKTVALSATDLGVCLLLSAFVFAAVEVRKWIARLRGAVSSGESE